jgi:hypothetical protein
MHIVPNMHNAVHENTQSVLIFYAQSDMYSSHTCYETSKFFARPESFICLPYYINQGSRVAMAGSKIDSSKFYYCEKSENLHSCSLIC